MFAEAKDAADFATLKITDVRLQEISKSFSPKKSSLSMQEARSKGILHLEAKEYLVKDGDVINLKLSV